MQEKWWRKYTNRHLQESWQIEEVPEAELSPYEKIKTRISYFFEKVLLTVLLLIAAIFLRKALKDNQGRN